MLNQVGDFDVGKPSGIQVLIRPAQGKGHTPPFGCVCHWANLGAQFHSPQLKFFQDGALCRFRLATRLVVGHSVGSKISSGINMFGLSFDPSWMIVGRPRLLARVPRIFGIQTALEMWLAGAFAEVLPGETPALPG